jgi:hypothetical protein
MVVPLAILFIFLVASTSGGVVLILLLLKMPILVVLQMGWLRYPKEELFILSHQPGHLCLQVGNSFSIPHGSGQQGPVDFFGVLTRPNVGHDFLTLCSPLSQIFIFVRMNFVVPTNGTKLLMQFPVW